MEIINVISTCYDDIISIYSFVIDKFQDREVAIKDAEGYFLECAEALGVDISNREYYLDEGFAHSGDYSIYLTWSTRVNK